MEAHLNSPLREITAYQLVDNHTGAVLATVPYIKRNALRRRRDKLDLAYGAVRYSTRPVFSTK